MKRVLVIGGSGFLGQELCQQLARSGNWEVSVFDAVRPEQPLPFIAGSILDVDRLYSAVKGQDAVIHLAAMLGVENCQKRPDEVIEVNLTGLENVLRAIQACGVRKFLFSSSSEIYGTPTHDRRFRETDRPRPRSLYARTKIIGEKAIHALSMQAPISCSVVRFFNAYGPRQRSDFVIPTFVDRAIAGETLVIHGDGSQNRTFTYIEDAAGGAISALEHNFEKPSTFDIFNIGSQETCSIATLAATVCELTNSRSEIRYVPFDGPGQKRNPAYEIMRRVPCVDKARWRLGFRARVSLKRGISEVARHRAQIVAA